MVRIPDRQMFSVGRLGNRSLENSHIGEPPIRVGVVEAIPDQKPFVVIGLDAEFTPAIVAYWARLQARPGFKAAKASQIKHAPAGAEAFPT